MCVAADIMRTSWFLNFQELLCYISVVCVDWLQCETKADERDTGVVNYTNCFLIVRELICNVSFSLQVVRF